jgi:uncharacterized protein (TIGR02246 family)
MSLLPHAATTRVADRLELEELPARYSRAIDDRDIPALLSLFCEDATFAHGDGSIAAHGIEQIERFYRDILSHYSFSLHLPQTQVVERIEGDHAVGWVLGRAELAENGRFAVAAMRYEDQYRRVAGRWRFASRVNHFYYFADWEELGKIGATTQRVRFRGDPRPADLPETLDTYQSFHGVERTR